jgi:hypothetical protein
MGFSSYDDLITQITTNGRKDYFSFTKTAAAASQGAGTWHSVFTGVGQPGAGSYSSQANTLQVGSINFANVSTRTRHILSFGATSTAAGVICLYDRLVEVSGIAFGSTGSKSVSTAALGRYTSGTGVQAWLEVTTAPTATAPICHLLSYTGDVNGASQVGGSFTWPSATTKVQSMLGPLGLASGDLGLTAVSTLNVDTAGSSSPVASLILMRPIAFLPVAANTWTERDMVLQLASLERIYDGMSLHVMQLCQASVTPTIWGAVQCGYE